MIPTQVRDTGFLATSVRHAIWARTGLGTGLPAWTNGVGRLNTYPEGALDSRRGEGDVGSS